MIGSVVLTIATVGIMIFDSFWFDGYRELWIALGFCYLVAAVILQRSRHAYPTRTWALFYAISLAILLFFNIEFWNVSQFVLRMVELFLLVCGFVIGVVLFALLLSIGDELDRGEVSIPTASELPVLIWEAAKEVYRNAY